MNILHLFSNWKLTGPAEPALNLALELRSRGHEVTFACGRRPPLIQPGGYLADVARERGIEPEERFHLDKHLRWWRNFRDIRRLRRYLRRRSFDLIHAHQTNDHLIAALSAGGTPVVRSCYAGRPSSLKARDRLLLRRAAGAFCFNARMRDELSGWLSAERRWRLEGAIDLDRFDPGRPLAGSPPHSREGLEGGGFVVGVVARVQPQRRFEVLIEAAARLREPIPGFRLWVMGRGSHRREVLLDPIAERGLDCIVPLGFHPGDAYLHLLAQLDVLVYLVPGSDESCRAVREALAFGVPVVAARRGMLDEIVEDGVDGRIIDDTVDDLVDTLAELERNRPRLEEMSRRARERSSRFGLSTQAAAVEAAYRTVLSAEHPAR